ncbi:Anticodon-binding domain of tRNA [Hymenobacter psychrophilus]|uniref:Valine--tRNA ligase n=2 Tax=Hymenobacter psychrophilus TaxID=651662 RepID=A0A1H3L8S3_9BACT|nr:Anticodon-binding domain of tRNA [Hymenobacter psychrophilus]
MPFITEEIWHELKERGPKEYACVAAWPKPQPVADAPALLARMAQALEVVGGVRTIRNQKGLGPNKPLTLAAKTTDATLQTLLADYGGIIRKLAALTDISVVEAAPAAAVGFVAGGAEFFVPLEGQIDLGAEKERLTKELEYAQGFRDSVSKKLSNEKFVANAKPELVERERQKLADAEAQIAALDQQLAGL